MYCSYSIQIKSHINNMDRKATETILRFYAFWKQFPLDKLSTKCFEIQIKIESKKPKRTLLEGKKLHKKLCLIDYKFHYTYLIWIYIIETWKLRQIYFIDVRTYMQRPVSKVYIHVRKLNCSILLLFSHKQTYWYKAIRKKSYTKYLNSIVIVFKTYLVP